MPSIPKTSGIYVIACSESKNVYIGCTNNFYKRWNEHQRRLNKGDHDNFHLQQAWNKYSEKAFQFKVLEYCAIDQLDEREKHHIQIYKKRGICYNVADGGRNITNTKRSRETCRKISLASTGRKHSPETKAKLSAINTGKKLSAETYGKVIELLKNNRDKVANALSKQYTVTTPTGEEIKIKNLSKFCRENNLTKQGMTMVAQGKQTHHKGWKCRYE